MGKPQSHATRCQGEAFGLFRAVLENEFVRDGSLEGDEDSEAAFECKDECIVREP